MKVIFALVVLAAAAGGVALVVLAIRKYNARKAFEAEREAKFVAEMLRAKLAPAQPAAGPIAPPADAASAAAASIRSALAAGRGADAAKAFLAVVEDRTRLVLEPPVWEALGRALLAQGSHMEAAWALHAGAAFAGDLAAAQKRLVEVAARAADAGQAQHALKLYATLLAKYPQSQFADFARVNMKELESRLPRS